MTSNQPAESSDPKQDSVLYRTNWNERAFTVGIAGPVGSGKTTVVLGLCKYLRDSYELCVVTNDIFTREDWEFLVQNKCLPEERIRSIKTEGCRDAIREDYMQNMDEIMDLTKKFKPQIILLESSGDNLAANFSKELVDYTIYIIDAAGGDRIPRKAGPNISECDLVVINKTDLAEAVGANIEVMECDVLMTRQDAPTILAQAKNNVGVDGIAANVTAAYNRAINQFPADCP